MFRPERTEGYSVRIRATLAPLRVAAFGTAAVSATPSTRSGTTSASSRWRSLSTPKRAARWPPARCSSRVSSSLRSSLRRYGARGPAAICVPSCPSIYLAEGAMFAGLAILAKSFALASVLALACLDGVLMLTARGLTRGAVNAILTPRDLLREGNALLNVAFAASNVGGSALGGSSSRFQRHDRALGSMRPLSSDRRAAGHFATASPRAQRAGAVRRSHPGRTAVRAPQPSCAAVVDGPVDRAGALHAHRPDRGRVRP